MHTWILIVTLFANFQANAIPVGITTIPGWRSLDECKESGKRIQEEQNWRHVNADYFCIDGPHR